MQRRTLVLGGACGLALAAMPALAAEAVDPFEWIVALNNSILDEIRADPKLHSGDQTALQALVDRRVMAAADFAMMTRMTIGPKWRKATKEERQRLMDGFEKLLIRVYSGALKTVTDHKCELRPTRNRTIKDEMVIRTILKSTGNPDIGIDFRIYRDKAGEWKIVDVNVEGIWMVENYRSQFASTLNTEGIPGLMKFGTESITFREAKKAKDDIANAVRNCDFVLDFEGVHRIDSTVLALSLHMLREAKKAGSTLRILSAPRGFADLVKLYGLETLLMPALEEV